MAKKKVLLVDDVKLFLELEKTLFHREGIEILVAHDGREALDTVRRETPNLVFIDLHMPEMDGEECCRRIKGDPAHRHIPVVIVTVARGKEDLDRCWDAGCNDIVFKPIERHSFIEMARELLRVPDRAAPRVATRVRVYFGPGEEEMLAGWTINLSTGGVFIECGRTFPPRTPLRVVLEIPGSREETRCLAQVAWVNDRERPPKPILPPGMGIQFLDLSTEALGKIRAHVRKLMISPA